MLYKCCERFGSLPADTFTVVQPQSYNHPAKDGKVWQVASEGKLCLIFSLHKAMAAAFANVPETHYEQLVEAHKSLTQLMPGHRKLVPLLAKWAMTMSPADQTVILDA